MKNPKDITRRLFVITTGAVAAGLTIIPGSVISGMEKATSPGVESLHADDVGGSPNGSGIVTVVQGKVELQTPQYIFKLDTSDGLRAVSWANRVTGRMLVLGGGPEVGFDIGLPDQLLVTPRLLVTGMPEETQATAGEAVFTLESEETGAHVKVVYRWDTSDPVLRKSVTIENRGSAAWNRLLNVKLGCYNTGGASVSDRPSGGIYSVPVPREFPLAGSSHVERGFPVYVETEFFLALAHPAGIAEGADGRVVLRQFPGVTLAPGTAFQCMEAVYGVANTGEARQCFVTHLQSRMLRVVRGHDRAYTIFDNFGSWPSDSFSNSEAYVLHSLKLLAESQKKAGVHFDLCSVDFWVDYHGTLKECDPERFPNGLKRIEHALDHMGTAMGLWIDGSLEFWTIGGNPDSEVQACMNYDLQKPDSLKEVQMERRAFCRATEPIRSMYTDAFRYHIRKNGVRLLKFDNTSCICVNPKHDHLPGLYSTEAIENGLIDFFQSLYTECPDVFLMLYWGYKSPWWLLHADTLFDSGLDMEAASPSNQPALYLRDSVTQKLDQGQRFASNIPALGKDSLGVWLSGWGWNSQIGKERWQEGFVMDICRGSLLGQIWGDNDWLSPAEWTQLADFLALLKAHPECFANSGFILGDPLKNEPYGYSCSDKRRAFLAINNATWQDHIVKLELGTNCGLPDDGRWDLYRWYPRPARLMGEREVFGSEVVMAMRPFEVVLLEAVPHGEAPALHRAFMEETVPAKFAEPSRQVGVTVAATNEMPAIWTVNGEIPTSHESGLLAVMVEVAGEDGQAVEMNNMGSFFEADVTVAGLTVEVHPVLGSKTYPASWQTWRIDVAPGSPARQFTMQIVDTCPGTSRRRFSAHFIPGGK
jgi:hypothetical protein